MTEKFSRDFLYPDSTGKLEKIYGSKRRKRDYWSVRRPDGVINQSLVGVVEALVKVPEVGRILGARHGVKGILGEDFIDLRLESADVLERVAATPSSALGSVRKKPTPEECRRMFDVMQKLDVRYFFYIGGNDSAETTHIVNEEARSAGYELRCFHVPKTVDNDLRVNDHTPGTAAPGSSRAP